MTKKRNKERHTIILELASDPPKFAATGADRWTNMKVEMSGAETWEAMVRMGITRRRMERMVFELEVGLASELGVGVDDEEGFDIIEREGHGGGGEERLWGYGPALSLYILVRLGNRLSFLVGRTLAGADLPVNFEFVDASSPTAT